MRIGFILRKWRIGNEITARELAEEIGLTPSTYSRVENNYDFDSDTMKKLIAWLFSEPRSGVFNKLNINISKNEIIPNDII